MHGGWSEATDAGSALLLGAFFTGTVAAREGV